MKKGRSEFDAHEKRIEILRKLSDDVDLARKWARATRPIQNRNRLIALRISIYGCSTYLSALKDQELELRIKQLEETVRNGVVIPGEQKPKR